MEMATRNNATLSSILVLTVAVAFISVSTAQENATTIQPTTTPTTPFPDDGFNCTEPGQYFIEHPIYCEYYYGCYNGVDSLLKCRGDLLFDLRYLGCNYPEQTDCQDREWPIDYPGTMTEGPTTTTIKPGNFTCPVKDDLYPDPEDCSMFYNCFDDVARHFQCSYPLLFHIQLKTCDFQLNVDCGDRPNPWTK